MFWYNIIYNKNNSNNYKWIDAIILYKIQEILENKNINELKILPNDDIKDYILRLKNYLNNTNFKCIKTGFKGIDFEVYKYSSIDVLPQWVY